MNYKRCLRIIFPVLVCVYWTGLHAQSTRIHGRVLNQNDRSAINGATIRVKNSPAYALSDQQGQVIKMAVQKISQSGTMDELLDDAGIDASHIVKKVKSALK